MQIGEHKEEGKKQRHTLKGKGLLRGCLCLCTFPGVGKW